MKIIFLCAIIMQLISVAAIIFKIKFILFIRRFSSLSIEERKEYDIQRLSRDLSNIFFIASVIIIIGIILGHFISEKISMILLLISVGFIIIKKFNIESEKAFNNYRILQWDFIEK